MKTLPLSSFSILLLGATIPAQFPGDVLFEPSAAATVPGGEFDVALQTFVGSERLGAIAVEVDFSAAELEVVSVAPSDMSYDEGLKWTVTSGRIRLTVVKDADVDGVIGTITLANIRLRALAGPGTVSTVTSRVVEGFDVDLDTYSSSTGFALQVSINAPSAPASSVVESVPQAEPTPEFWVDGWSLAGFFAAPAPLGAAVEKYVFDPVLRAVRRVRVRSYRPGAPREVGR